MTARNLVSVVLIVAAAVLGFLFGTASAGKTNYSMAPAPAGSQQQSVVSQNPIFKSQSAIFQGVITQVSGKNLLVRDDKGATATLPVSSKLVIYKFNGTSPQASASSDLKSIDLNKQVLVMLELSGSQYQVTSVSYLPPPPAPKP